MLLSRHQSTRNPTGVTPALDSPIDQFRSKFFLFNCKKFCQPGAPELRDDSKDSTFAIAQEFMDMTHRLKELETLLIRQKAELEDNYKELKEMGENIKKQSLHALQQQVYCRPD